MSIGARLRALRLRRGLTQKELGERCGMADSAIRRYESGRGNPTEKTLCRLAAALEVSPAVLQGWEEAVDALEAAGFSLTDLADELNLPPEELSALVEELDAEGAAVLIRAARLLTLAPAREARAARERPRLQRLEDVFSRLSPEGQQVALARLEELAQLPQYQRSPEP